MSKQNDIDEAEAFERMLEAIAADDVKAAGKWLAISHDLHQSKQMEQHGKTH